MNKTAIRKFAERAREKLIDEIKYKAGTVGITENGIAEKLPQSTSDLRISTMLVRRIMRKSLALKLSREMLL